MTLYYALRFLTCASCPELACPEFIEGVEGQPRFVIPESVQARLRRGTQIPVCAGMTSPPTSRESELSELERSSNLQLSALRLVPCALCPSVLSSRYLTVDLTYVKSTSLPKQCHTFFLGYLNHFEFQNTNKIMISTYCVS